MTDNGDPTAICGDCGQEFSQKDAYVCPVTPGFDPPVGKGAWPATAYCPECGALIAEDEEGAGWVWRGASVAANTGPPSIPDWLGTESRQVPRTVTPLHEERRVDVQAAREWERLLEQDPIVASAPKSRDLRREATRLADGGDLRSAEAKLDEALVQGLSKVEHANTLGEWGTWIVGEADPNDIERIGDGIRLCERSISLWKSASWKAHYIVGLEHRACNEESLAEAEIADAHRYALTEWWDQTFEWGLNHRISNWAALRRTSERS